MEAIDYWRKFAQNPKEGMTYDEFSAGYRHSNPEVGPEQIDGAWREGD